MKCKTEQSGQNVPRAGASQTLAQVPDRLPHAEPERGCRGACPSGPGRPLLRASCSPGRGRGRLLAVPGLPGGGARRGRGQGGGGPGASLRAASVRPRRRTPRRVPSWQSRPSAPPWDEARLQVGRAGRGEQAVWVVALRSWGVGINARKPSSGVSTRGRGRCCGAGPGVRLPGAGPRAVPRRGEGTCKRVETGVLLGWARVSVSQAMLGPECAGENSNPSAPLLLSGPHAVGLQGFNVAGFSQGHGC